MPIEMIRNEKHVPALMLISCAMNLLVSVFLAWGILPVDKFTLRFTGGFFLMVFVCLHGWHRYGWQKMVLFFCITTAVTWPMESLSIATGFPFGKFIYTELLGAKIGEVPILIIPAYFFNGYLAWTMANLFAGNTGIGIRKKDLILVPFISSLIMVMWNVCFEPVMSTIEGNWIWQGGGIYGGVPISNFLGWFITVFLVFLAYAAVLYKTGDDDYVAIRPSHWYLFPAMYMAQGLPGLLYPFFQTGHSDIYRPVAQVTIMTMFAAALFNVVAIYRNQHGISLDADPDDTAFGMDWRI